MCSNGHVGYFCCRITVIYWTSISIVSQKCLSARLDFCTEVISGLFFYRQCFHVHSDDNKGFITMVKVLLSGRLGSHQAGHTDDHHGRPSFKLTLAGSLNRIEWDLNPELNNCEAAVRTTQSVYSHILSFSIHGTWWAVLFEWIRTHYIRSLSDVISQHCSSLRWFLQLHPQTQIGISPLICSFSWPVTRVSYQ